MKNNMKKIVSLLLCVLMVMPLITACKDHEDDPIIIPPQPVEYTISYNSVGGTEVASATIEENTDITEPQAPSKPYHTFDGWYKTADYSSTRFLFGKMPSENIQLYAKWTPLNKYKITLISDGSRFDEIISGEGEAVAAPEAPISANFDFAGWYLDEALTQSYTFDKMPGHNLKLYAKWSLKNTVAEVKIIAYGDVLKSFYITKGETVNLAGILPAKYIIEGWYSNAELTSEYTSAAIEANTSIYAKYYSSDIVFSSGSVLKYNGKDKKIVIPKVINGNTVTTILGSVFADNQYVEEVILPDSVVEIENFAFYRCENLKTVRFSEALTTIGRYAFSGCLSLETADIPNVVNLGEGAFALCSSLTEVNLNNSLIGFNDKVFYHCSSLKSISIGANFASFGTESLTACVGLQTFSIDPNNQNFVLVDKNVYNKNITTLYFYIQADKLETTFEIPATVTKIEKGAFYQNTNLTSLEIPATVTEIQRGAFEKFNGLASLTITDFGFLPVDSQYLSYVFGATTALSNIGKTASTPATLQTLTIKDASITSLPNYMFYGFTGLRTVNGINNLQTIGKFAFAYTGLVTFAFGKDVSAIGEGAFAHCDQLVSFTVDAANAKYSGSNDGYLYLKDGKTLAKVPAGILKPEIKSTVNTLAAFAFDYGAHTEIDIPLNVTSIELAAVNSCTKLEKVSTAIIGDGGEVNTHFAHLFGAPLLNGAVIAEDYLPASLITVEIKDNITVIPSSSFSRCDIKNIILPETLTEIGIFAFSYNQKAEEIVIPASVETVNSYAFANCFLKKVVIPGTVKNLGLGVYAQNPLIATIVVGEGVTSIPDSTFAPYTEVDSANVTQVCSLLDSITLPSTVTRIGVNAFRGAGVWYNTPYSINLNFTNKENSVLTTIDEYAFTSSAAVEIDLPASVEVIGEGAFYTCLILRAVRFANGSKLKTIGVAAFSGTVLTKIDIPATVEVIESDAFAYADLSTVNFAKDSKLTSIGKSAFESNSIIELAIPASVKTIGQYAFYNCTLLKTLTFGSAAEESQLASIGGWAFYNNRSLASVTLHKTITSAAGAPTLVMESRNDIAYDPFVVPETAAKFNLYVPQAAVAFYKTATNWTLHAARIYGI